MTDNTCGMCEQGKTCEASTTGPSRGGARRVLAVLLILTLVSAASVAAYMHYRMNYCITTIVPGRLYRSAEMTPERLVKGASQRDIVTVIDLRNPGFDDKGMPEVDTAGKIQREDAAMKAAGITHISLPAEQLPPEETIDRFIAMVDSAGKKGPVLIHCDHGIGRTGLFVALYLMEFAGYSNEDARRCVARYYSIRPRGRKHFAPGFDKGKFIMEYRIRNSIDGDVRGDTDIVQRQKLIHRVRELYESRRSNAGQAPSYRLPGSGTERRSTMVFPDRGETVEADANLRKIRSTYSMPEGENMLGIPASLPIVGVDLTLRVGGPGGRGEELVQARDYWCFTNGEWYYVTTVIP